MAVLEYCAKHNMIVYLEKIDKNAQFDEIVDFLPRSSIFYALTARIKKLEKKCKPSISHHRAWLRSVSLLSKKKKLSKRKFVSKQGRKNAKLGPTKVDSDKINAELDEDMEQELSTAGPTTTLTTTTIFDDEEMTFADTLIKLKDDKAKGVAFKDSESTDRPARSILTLKPLPTIVPKEKGKGVLEEPESAKKTTKKYFERRKKQLAEERDAAIRNKPPTKTQLRRLMMTYLKNMGGCKGCLKRQKTDVDLEEEEKLKTFLKIDPDEEGVIDYKVLDKRFLIINWESKFYHYDRHGAEGIYYRIFRSDGSSRWIKTFSEMVTRFDRLDLVELYNLVMQRFKLTTPEGVDLILWGDLRTLFEANAKDELWQNQEK
nr:hypothetical protein [Tanacetum cinerariifolium]